MSKEPVSLMQLYNDGSLDDLRSKVEDMWFEQLKPKVRN